MKEDLIQCILLDNCIRLCCLNHYFIVIETAADCYCVHRITIMLEFIVVPQSQPNKSGRLARISADGCCFNGRNRPTRITINVSKAYALRRQILVDLYQAANDHCLSSSRVPLI